MVPNFLFLRDFKSMRFDSIFKKYGIYMFFFDFFKNLIDAREEWLRKKNVNDVSVYYNTTCKTSNGSDAKYNHNIIPPLRR